MSVASNCPDCCTCPTPTVEWDSRSASKSKSGYVGFQHSPWGSATTPVKIYATATWSGTVVRFAFDPPSFCPDIGNRLSRNWGKVRGTGTLGADGTCSSSTVEESSVGASWPNPEPAESWSAQDCDNGFAPYYVNGALASSAQCSFVSSGYLCASNVVNYGGSIVTTGDSVREWAASGDTVCVGSAPYTYSGSRKLELGSEYTTLLLQANAVAALPAWDDDWNDTAGSFANLSTDELTYAIRESRYRLRFKIPLVNTGLNYRLSWVERFIPEAGVGVDSVDVYSRGVYRPTVTLSAPPTGGVQAYAVAVMSSTGTVTSIRILNPGAGYTSAPTVTVQSASGGGTSSTGWTATLTAGQVSAIASGSAGNYLPTLAFSGGGGSGATATATMDDRGGISAVTVGASGSGYTSAPTLAITAKVTGSTAADLLLHLGTETARCAVWDGVEPGGYDPGDSTTYPIIGDGTNDYFELPVPTADGTTLVANLRAVCDGTAC